MREREQSENKNSDEDGIRQWPEIGLSTALERAGRRVATSPTAVTALWRAAVHVRVRVV